MYNTVMEKTMKLAKFLAHSGVASRRASEELILKGKIQVNGQVEKNVARRIDPKEDVIFYAGQPIQIQTEKILLLLNKPPGVVSTSSDPDNKKTVLDFVPSKYKNYRLYPVGRLDEESEGLILLTNDGDLAYRLSHPKFQIPRVYEVTIAGRLSALELRRLRFGVPLKDGRTKRAEVEIIDDQKQQQVLQITLTEGRNHQIRRMMDALNHPVLKLVRLSHGDFELGELKTGQVKLVNQKK